MNPQQPYLLVQHAQRIKAFYSSPHSLFTLLSVDLPNQDIQEFIRDYFEFLRSQYDIPTLQLKLSKRKDKLRSAVGGLLYKMLLPHSDKTILQQVKLLGLQALSMLVLRTTGLLSSSFNYLKSEVRGKLPLIFKELRMLNFQADSILFLMLRNISFTSLSQNNLNYFAALLSALSLLNVQLISDHALTIATLFTTLLRYHGLLLRGNQLQPLLDQNSSFINNLFQKRRQYCLMAGRQIFLDIQAVSTDSRLKALFDEISALDVVSIPTEISNYGGWCPFYSVFLSPETERALLSVLEEDTWPTARMLVLQWLLKGKNFGYAQARHLMIRGLVKYIRPKGTDNRHILILMLIKEGEDRLSVELMLQSVFFDWLFFSESSSVTNNILPGIKLLQALLLQDTSAVQDIFKFIFYNLISFTDQLKASAEVSVKNSFLTGFARNQLSLQLLHNQAIPFTVRHWVLQLLKDKNNEFQQEYNPDLVMQVQQPSENVQSGRQEQVTTDWTEEQPAGSFIQVDQQISLLFGEVLQNFLVSPGVTSLKPLIMRLFEVERELRIQKKPDQIQSCSQELSRIVYKMLQNHVEQPEVRRESYLTYLLTLFAIHFSDQIKREALLRLLRKSLDLGIVKYSLLLCMVTQKEINSMGMHKLLESLYLKSGQARQTVKGIRKLVPERWEQFKVKAEASPGLKRLIE